MLDNKSNLSGNEYLKMRSNGLRGTIAESLEKEITGDIN